MRLGIFLFVFLVIFCQAQDFKWKPLSKGFQHSVVKVFEKDKEWIFMDVHGLKNGISIHVQKKGKSFSRLCFDQVVLISINNLDGSICKVFAFLPNGVRFLEANYSHHWIVDGKKGTLLDKRLLRKTKYLQMKRDRLQKDLSEEQKKLQQMMHEHRLLRQDFLRKIHLVENAENVFLKKKKSLSKLEAKIARVRKQAIAEERILSHMLYEQKKTKEFLKVARESLRYLHAEIKKDAKKLKKIRARIRASSKELIQIILGPQKEGEKKKDQKKILQKRKAEKIPNSSLKKLREKFSLKPKK